MVHGCKGKGVILVNQVIVTNPWSCSGRVWWWWMVLSSARRSAAPCGHHVTRTGGNNRQSGSARLPAHTASATLTLHWDRGFPWLWSSNAILMLVGSEVKRNNDYCHFVWAPNMKLQLNVADILQTFLWMLWIQCSTDLALQEKHLHLHYVIKY